MQIKTNSIHRAYLEKDSKIESYFNTPLKPDWPALCKSVLDNYSGEIFFEELIRQNKNFENKAVQKNLQQLSEKNTLTVVTGQQLGLFVSPLYTVYKTLTVLKMTEELNRTVEGYNFVPVFWLEGEDHDFDEINHIYILDESNALREFSVAQDQELEQYSINKQTLPDNMDSLFNRLKDNLQDSEFSKSLFEILRDIYTPGRNWIEAFAEQMQMLFAGYGLLLFNPSTDWVKQNSIPFFESVIDKNDRFSEVLAEASQNLNDAGYFNQVEMDRHKSYLFLSYKDRRRFHIYKSKNCNFYLKDTDKNWDKEELKKLLHGYPHWFSSSVFTRPLWQSFMLPVASYVAGPAEIAYWAQLKPAFELFNITMPHLQPRISMMQIEPPIQRIAGKLNIDLNSVPEDAESLVNSYLKGNQLKKIEEEFGDIREKIEDFRAKIDSPVQNIDPTLASPVEKSIKNISSTLSKLENRLVNQSREREKVTVNQLKRLHTALFPDGKPQERVLSSIYFLNKYGLSWIEQLYKHVDWNRLDTQLFEL